MANAYTYSLSGDLGGNLSPNQLREEINDSNISLICYSVKNVGNNVYIIFASALSESEQTTLANLVSSHVPTAYVGKSVANIYANFAVVTTIYMTVCTFDFPGKNIFDISTFKIICFIEDGGVSCDVRVYDITNNNKICSVTFNNTSYGIINLGSISNLPSGEAIFELQAKINGVTTGHIKNLSMYYD